MTQEARVVNIARREIFEVYIGRITSCPEDFRGPGSDGRYGNPVRVGGSCLICGQTHREPSSTLDCYRVWLAARLRVEPTFLDPLKGKRLGCFCVPQKPCHGGVILEFLAGEADQPGVLARMADRLANMAD